MNACAVLVLPHRFNIHVLPSKTPARIFVRLSRKFFRNDEFVNETPAGLLLGVAENFGEFPIDLQDSVICVEQDDRLWHSRKEHAKNGLLANSFGDRARLYPVSREPLRRTHTANPASRHGFRERIKTELIKPRG